MEFAKRYGPVALVTGASSGIGVGFAELLAARGLDLVLVARRVERLEALGARLQREHGVQAKALQIDLARPEAPRQILDATAALDVGLVVSNAGFGMKGEHAGNDPQAMTDMLMVNCNVPMQLAHGFIPRLRQRGRGGVIFTSSVEAMIGTPYSAAYASSKALLNALGEGLWGELNPEGIDVLTVCPGLTDTEAPASQGFDDITTMPSLMSAQEVAGLSLENIRNGPTLYPNEFYRAQMEPLLSLPRRDALVALAANLKVICENAAATVRARSSTAGVKS